MRITYRIGRCLAAAMLFACLIPQTALAEDDVRCGAPEGSTGREACLLSRSIKKLEASLNDVVGLIVQDLKKNNESDGVAEAFFSAQEAWANFRDTHCHYEQEANGGAFGISFLRCLEQMNEERLESLKGRR